MSMSVHRCEAEPIPACPYVTLSFSARIQANSSSTVFAATAFFDTTVIGTSLMRPIGSKSFMTLNLMSSYSAGAVAIAMCHTAIV